MINVKYCFYNMYVVRIVVVYNYYYYFLYYLDWFV